MNNNVIEVFYPTVTKPKKKSKLKIILLVSIPIILLIAFAVLYFTVISPKNKYDKAMNYFDNKNYKEEIVKDLITGEENKTNLPNSNVLYYELENNSWCCVRPSGTEPKIKFYLGVKADSFENADKELEFIKQDILRNLRIHGLMKKDFKKHSQLLMSELGK